MREPYAERIHTPLRTMTSTVREHSFLLAVLAAALVAPAPGQASTSMSWPLDQALPWFAPPQHLHIADVQSLPGDGQLLFNTLEGLVNVRADQYFNLLSLANGLSLR